VSQIQLSVIITVFSETFSIEQTVQRLLRNDRGYIKELILVVSPRSSTECMRVCEQLARDNSLIRVHIQQRNPGVGWAIREGMHLASGTHCALLSADLETEPEAVDRMVRKIEDTGCDGVIGNRWLPGGGFENYEPVKLVLNWLFQHAFRVLYWTKLGDLTYGFKTLSMEVARAILWEGIFHEIYIETTVRPLRRGYRLEQVPTIWVGRREGQSQNSFIKNLRYVRTALNTLFRENGRPPEA
jgi:glycosyltransferase involved in cell wall biosynthesis